MDLNYKYFLILYNLAASLSIYNNLFTHDPKWTINHKKTEH